MSGVIPLLSSGSEGFDTALQRLLSKRGAGDQPALEIAQDIIDRIRNQGDIALLELTANLDRHPVESVEQLKVSPQRLATAVESIPAQLREALELAAERIDRYHQQQKAESWQFTDAVGNRLGQRLSALERVGVYVPGGKAAYPSSVLMNVIPARVAGVDRVVMVSPMPDGEPNQAVLAAAAIAGVDEFYAIGGAQAVAALALGTESVPAVDKIVGPGNRYVAAAKQLLYGQVGIDMLAGPSEILVIADSSCDPDWVAMDLFSQAEHDELAQAILLTPDRDYLQQVYRAI